jgi:phospholipase C
MASAGGMVLASFALPSSLRKIIDGTAPAARNARLTSAPISGIEHVVVLMQENRSFDHYFGTMPGVRGFADPSVPKSRFYQYDAENPDKYLLPDGSQVWAADTGPQTNPGSPTAISVISTATDKVTTHAAAAQHSGRDRVLPVRGRPPT